jgi:hypothetical protein
MPKIRDRASPGGGCPVWGERVLVEMGDDHLPFRLGEGVVVGAVEDAVGVYPEGEPGISSGVSSTP